MQVYHAASPTVVLPPDWLFERKARLVGFSKDAVLFADGSQLIEWVAAHTSQHVTDWQRSVDTVYLGTGFIVRYEYLERGGALVRRPGQLLPRIEDEAFDGIVSTDLYSATCSMPLL